MQQHRKKTGEKLPSKERNTADKTTAVNNTVMVNINLMIKTANNWWSQGSISHTTQNGSFLRRSSQPISRHSTEKTKPNTTKANNIRTKLEARCFTKHKPHAGRRKCRKILFFLSLLTLTFDPDLQTRPSGGSNMYSTWIWHMCAHIIVYNCCTQHRTEQFWSLSLLSFGQSSWLR